MCPLQQAISTPPKNQPLLKLSNKYKRKEKIFSLPQGEREVNGFHSTNMHNVFRTPRPVKRALRSRKETVAQTTSAIPKCRHVRLSLLAQSISKLQVACSRQNLSRKRLCPFAHIGAKIPHQKLFGSKEHPHNTSGPGDMCSHAETLAAATLDRIEPSEAVEKKKNVFKGSERMTSNACVFQKNIPTHGRRKTLMGDTKKRKSASLPPSHRPEQ